MQRKKVMTTILMVVLGLALGAFDASEASAAPSVITAPNAADASGYCGPPVTSKAAMINWYMDHPYQRSKAERHVRANWRYYHIQPDQSFLAWLQMPNVKYFRAPADYRIRTNTYCLGDGTVAPYYGRYGVGGIYMMWWCDDPRGYNCTPIAKGYCRNFVTGRKIKPKPKPKPKPRPVPKPKPKPKAKVPILIEKHALSAANEEQLLKPTPTGIFRFRVQCGLMGKPRFIVYNSDPQPAGYCHVSAGRVLIWELTPLGPDKWQFLSPVYQTFRLKGKKVIRAVYKNKQVREVPKTEVDVCPNIPGLQVVIPPGYVRDSAGNCVIPPPAVVDVCPNLDGVQPSVPSGYVLENGLCVLPKTETDMCLNIVGIQVVVPPFYNRDQFGNCHPA